MATMHIKIHYQHIHTKFKNNIDVIYPASLQSWGKPFNTGRGAYNEPLLIHIYLIQKGKKIALW